MFGQFFVLFGLMAVGYFCSRKKYLNSEMTTGIGNLVLFVTIPAMLFSVLSNTRVEQEVLLNFALMTGMQFLAMLIFGRLIRWYYRFRRFEESHLNMLEVTAASVNNAFIGFPIAAMFFGEEGLVYMSAGVLGLNLYIWSFGLYIIKGTKGETFGSMMKNILQGALNPNISSIVLGLLVAVTGIMVYVPQPIQTLLGDLGGVSTPLSLIYIGALTGNSGFRQLLRDRETLSASAIKIIAMPLFAFALVFFLPISPLLKAIFFVEMALPSAAIVPMIVGRYGIGVEVSSKMVLVTTALSIIALPICIAISSIWI